MTACLDGLAHYGIGDEYVAIRHVLGRLIRQQGTPINHPLERALLEDPRIKALPTRILAPGMAMRVVGILERDLPSALTVLEEVASEYAEARVRRPKERLVSDWRDVYKGI